MGQYQQWLLAQEIDRRLKAEIETLETELFYLQDRMTILEQVVPSSENVILQVLAAHLQQQDRQEQEQLDGEAAHMLAESAAQSMAAGEETSSAPLDEKTIPYFLRTSPQNATTADMLALLGEHSHATPDLSALFQRERPDPQASGPEDEETRRLNESIQRWFVRWHRQIARGVQEEETDDEQ